MIRSPNVRRQPGDRVMTSRRTELAPTLKRLNRKLAERGAGPLPVNRFRPNIVIAVGTHPHAEERAHRITIGETELGYGYAKLAICCAA